MSAWTDWRPQDRADRHVRTATLVVAADAPVRRLAFLAEEALRLTTLPGENEGRVYYFRKVTLTGLPASGDRVAWLERFQQALHDQASRALHGSDPDAVFSESVYFDTSEEALETLLDRVLTRRPALEWFWPDAAPVAAAAWAARDEKEAFQAIVEQLRALPAGWLAVARSLFAAARFDAPRLFALLARPVASRWVAEMGERPAAGTPGREALARAARPAIERVLRIAGAEDPRTVWLAALAVMVESPAEAASGTAVSRARAALRQLVADRSAARPEARWLEERVERLPRPEPAGAAPKDSRKAGEGTSREQRIDAAAPHEASLPRNADSTAEPERSEAAESAEDLAAPVAPVAPERALRREWPVWRFAGEPTRIGGLFFLLNALRAIGAAEAIEALDGAISDFIPRILRHLASQSDAAPQDPTLRWLDSRIAGPPTMGLLDCDNRRWPNNLRRFREAAPADHLVRVWSVGVRRWCLRMGRIAARDVIARGAAFSADRTDIDVSLPLDELDVRVRRIGLDLDPGWVPWFGWVVRFHYVSAEELPDLRPPASGKQE